MSIQTAYQGTFSFFQDLPIVIESTAAQLSSDAGLLAIRDIGGGQFQIASFFDVFTELSIDGGLNWINSDGSTRMTLVPEPATLLLLAGGLIGLAVSRRKLSA